MSTYYTLPGETLFALYPFGVFTDQSGNILDVGPSMLKLLKVTKIDQKIDTIIRCKYSKCGKLIHGDMIGGEIQGTDLSALGLMIELAGGHWFLALQIKTISIDGISKYGLSDQDFAKNDPAIEYSAIIENEKQANTELLRIDKFRRNLIDHLPAAVSLKDKTGRYIMVNSAFKTCFGKEDSDYLGKQDSRLFDEEFAAEISRQDTFAIEEGVAGYSEILLPDNSGEVRHFDVYRYFGEILDDDSSALISVSVDVTERRKMELELRSQKRTAELSERLASIGQLAAGVGHEINNPLAVVLAHAQTILLKTRKGKGSLEEFLPKIEKIESAALKISKIVRGLKTFSRSEKAPDEPYDPSSAVEDTIGLIKDIYEREGVVLGFNDESEESIMLNGNHGKFQQVIMNLISNAKDALEGVENPKIGVNIKYEKNSEWAVTVSDNGCGVPPEIQVKIFDAFFTTKSVGKGTGLGLSLVHEYVQDLGGRLLFDSKVGEGTTFRLIFEPNAIQSAA